MSRSLRSSREIMKTEEFLLIVNGAQHTVRCEPDIPLLDQVKQELDRAQQPQD